MSDDLKPIAEMVRDAEKHAEAMAADRVRAIEYYRGEMSDLPADDGRSKMVSRDAVQRFTDRTIPPR